MLMCVHGLTRTGRDFDALAQSLCGEYRVVCPRRGWPRTLGLAA
ncbi:hypothetical protein ACTMU2_30120 [Cupriavidus basilensis]